MVNDGEITEIETYSVVVIDITDVQSTITNDIKQPKVSVYWFITTFSLLFYNSVYLLLGNQLTKLKSGLNI
jgi:hypothetical protein